MLDGVLVDLIFDAVVVEVVDEVLNSNDFLGIFVWYFQLSSRPAESLFDGCDKLG